MTQTWLLFASLSVVGSLIFNVGTKLGSSHADAFGFMFVMTAVVLLVLGFCCLAAQYGFGVDVTRGLNAHAIKYAVLAGLGVVLIDVGYFIAFRYGSAVSTQVFWAIGGMIAFAVFAVLFLGETMSLTKALGILLGIASVVLITKAP